VLDSGEQVRLLHATVTAWLGTTTFAIRPCGPRRGSGRGLQDRGALPLAGGFGASPRLGRAGWTRGLVPGISERAELFNE
jgi:hypothetical protein